MTRQSSPLVSQPAAVEATPAVPRSRGMALDATTRAAMEARFAHDFGQVRVHADQAAAVSARAAQAQAYTVGSDIVFGAGRYGAGSHAADPLLAHELAHVVQQSQGGAYGHAADAEARADAAAERAVRGEPVAPQALGGAPLGLQAKPGDAPLLPPPVVATTETLANVSIEAGETISKTNPKLVQIAESYKSGAGGGLRVALSADLPSDAKNSSERENTERGRLGSRMRDVRDALQSLGVPFDAVDITPATAYSTAAHGQIGAAVRQRSVVPSPLGPFVPLAPQGVVPPAGVPPAPAAALPSLDLDLTFGPVTISLPKEVRAKLPIPLAGAKKLVIELGIEVPAKFTFKITLDGTPHVRVSLKAGAELDPKNTSATASAGLTIETTATTCNAADPGETREKIKSAGDKLNKAAQEFEAASGTDKLGKAFEIAGAIGEMYDAVDKAKAKCKQVPVATFDLGYKRLLTPGSETDPTKLPPLDYAGVTATFHF
jgi:hypothetical protein